MRQVKHIVSKRFKYGGEWLDKGDEFEPDDGKYDDLILKHYTTPEYTGFTCVCGRTFDSKRGLTTHQRYCEE